MERDKVQNLSSMWLKTQTMLLPLAHQIMQNETKNIALCWSLGRNAHNALSHFTTVKEAKDVSSKYMPLCVCVERQQSSSGNNPK